MKLDFSNMSLETRLGLISDLMKYPKLEQYFQAVIDHYNSVENVNLNFVPDNLWYMPIKKLADWRYIIRDGKVSVNALQNMDTIKSMEERFRYFVSNGVVIHARSEIVSLPSAPWTNRTMYIFWDDDALKHSV